MCEKNSVHLVRWRQIKMKYDSNAFQMPVNEREDYQRIDVLNGLMSSTLGF